MTPTKSAFAPYADTSPDNVEKSQNTLRLVRENSETLSSLGTPPSLFKTVASAFENFERHPGEFMERLKEIFAKAVGGIMSEVNDLEHQIGLAGGKETLQKAMAYGSVSAPAGFADTYEMDIAWEDRNNASDWSIGNGAGAVDEKSKKEKAEDEAEDALENFRDNMERVSDAQRESAEKWDRMQSAEIEGMTNAQVLGTLKTINGNQSMYLDMAVKKGIIKEDEKDAFAKWLQIKQKELEYERTHSGQHDASLQQQLDLHPNFEPAFVKLEKDAKNGLEANGLNSNSVSSQERIKNILLSNDGLNDLNKNAFEDADDKKISANSGKDKIFPTAPEINKSFNSAAEGKESLQIAKTPAFTRAPQVSTVENNSIL